MYTLSSLPPLSLPLSEVSVSDLSPSLPAKKWSCDSLLSCHVYFATNAEIRYGHDACGGGDCGGGGNGVVFFRYIRNSASLVIFVLRVYKFIWKLFT